MILNDQAFQKILDASQSYSVFYYYSTEEYLVKSAIARTITELQKTEDADVVTIEGPAPSIEQAIAAAGTISFFGTKRIVELIAVEPSAMKDSDITALCDLMQSLENAVIVMGTVYKDDKAKTTKKAKTLIETAQKTGIAGDWAKPGQADAKRLLQKTAEHFGVTFAPRADQALLVRCGLDLFLLENEVAKLAAASGYTVITEELVSKMGTQNIEADIFEMVRLVTNKNKTKVLQKLQQLIELQNEPIAITAALSGAFIDMYRVKYAAKAHKNIAAVQKDFGYRGSDYRLRKSGENGAKYSLGQLEESLSLLEQLDIMLKSSAADSVVLLQTTLCEMMKVGESR